MNPDESMVIPIQNSTPMSPQYLAAIKHPNTIASGRQIAVIFSIITSLRWTTSGSIFPAHLPIVANESHLQFLQTLSDYTWKC